MPSPRSSRRESRKLLLLADAQAGGGFVEQQKHGIEAECAGDLDQPQLA